MYSQVLEFYNSFHCLLSKIPEAESLEKNSTTGTDLSVLLTLIKTLDVIFK